MYKYIEEKLVYYKELVDSMADDRNPDWNQLEDIFRKIVVHFFPLKPCFLLFTCVEYVENTRCFGYKLP